jgi:hypothetical protein
MTRRLASASLLLLTTVIGCAKSPPAVVEVSGVVLLDGQPLPKAKVEFVPQLKDFGAQYNSVGVTDEKGRFTLQCGIQKPGAVVGHHLVLVSNNIPSEYRRADGDTQGKLAQYLASLKNRPIPEEYGSISMKPYPVEVTADKTEYELKLTRKP